MIGDMGMFSYAPAARSPLTFLGEPPRHLCVLSGEEIPPSPPIPISPFRRGEARSVLERRAEGIEEMGGAALARAAVVVAVEEGALLGDHQGGLTALGLE